MATHSSIVAPENPIQPGELQSMGLQRVGHKQKRLSMHACY